MDVVVAGFTIDVIGKVLLGISVYFVHGRIMNEGKIDKIVLEDMKRERWFAIAGIVAERGI